MTDEEVRLLARSGVNHMGFGTESASDDVLLDMNKLHQNVPDMFETARKARQAGIWVTFNLIFGYPGETDDDRGETFRVMGEIAERYDNVSFSPNILTPYPGITLWPELERRGVRQPDSLGEWTELALSHNVLPWIAGEPYRRVQAGMSLLLLANEVSKRIRKSPSRAERVLLRSFRTPLTWRLKHQFHGWPLELWLYRMRKRLVMRRSLLTGEKLGYSLDQAC
jgi:radical SAM superfamily enzyme YgiQ (UPF0313 family)